MSVLQDKWREAIDMTSHQARRYRWLRENLDDAAAQGLDARSLDLYIDTCIEMNGWKTGADLI